MIRTHGSAAERHDRLFGSPVAFLVVAHHAGTHQVLPGVFPTPGDRYHVIHRERQIRPSTELTAMCIPPENILAGKDDTLIRNFHIDRQAYDAWIRYRQTHRPDHLPVVRFDHFRFAKKEECYGLLDVDHTHRLVILVKNENLCVKAPSCASGFKYSAEDIPSYPGSLSLYRKIYVYPHYLSSFRGT
jgi:hypothetical protein